MTIFYHGAHSLFEKFTKSCADSQGFKCGYGVYVTSVHSFAAQCSNDTNGDHYVYTVEIPEKTESNHIAYKQPVHKNIVEAVQKALGIVFSSEAQMTDGSSKRLSKNIFVKEGRHLLLKMRRKCPKRLGQLGSS